MATNSSSAQHAEHHAGEAALMAAAAFGDVTILEVLQDKDPVLVYAHKKAGDNIGQRTAHGAHVEVRSCVEVQKLACILATWRS